MDLSMIIPVWNERPKVVRDIRQAADFLVRNKLRGEILVVDDGSSDGTAQTARSAGIPDSVRLEVIASSEHCGKGFAVKTGMLRAQGKIALFIDSGSCVPHEDILTGMACIRSGRCEIAHGSRFLKESEILKPQNPRRRIGSFLFRHFIRFYVNAPTHLTDTQCGLKLYRGETARRLFSACETEGFMFDIEIILRAQEQGARICEFPIHWSSDPDSRLCLSRALFSVFKELYEIKKRMSSAGRIS